MKNAGEYFKDPPNQALKELFEWAGKWLRDEVEIAMFIAERDDRNCVLTMTRDGMPEPSRTDRLRILERAVDAILSNKSDAQHGKLEL